MAARVTTRLAAMLTAVAFSLFVILASADDSWRKVSTTGSYTSRSDNAFSVCGDQLCLLGGRDDCSGEGNCVSKPADVFDTEEKTWTRRDTPPVKGGLHHFQSAPDPTDPSGDCVWVGGAFKDGFPNENTVDDIWIFCAKAGKWRKGPAIDRPRGGGGAFTWDGKYYLIAGNVGGHGAQASVEAWFDVYDPETRKWSKLEDQPNARDHFTAVVQDDKLYVAGGRDTGVADFFNAVEESVDVYDLKKGKWSTLSTKYPDPRGGTLSAVQGDRMVFAGGEGFGTASDKLFFFDGKKFSEGPSMLTPKHGTSFASCNGALWVAGGVSEQGGEPEIRTTEVLASGDDIPTCSASKAGSASKDDNDGDSDDSSSSSSGSSDSSDSSSDNPRCFPGASTVELESGAVVPMSHVRLGDRVRVENGAFSPVYFFSHKASDVTSDFVRITTDASEKPLSLTEGHLLPVNGKLTPAARVVVGDTVMVASRSGRDQPASVVAVDRYSARDALPLKLATALLVPIRTVYGTLGAVVSSAANDALLALIERVDVAQGLSLVRTLRSTAEAFGVKSEL